jgi:hypothetical protein
MQSWKKQFWKSALKTAAVFLFLCCLLPSNSNAQLLAPAITEHPTNAVVPNGATATFKVEAYSLLGVTYSWYHNGEKIGNSTRITGANDSTCVISNVRASDGGNYYAQVRNLIGGVESHSATLTLIYPPVALDSIEMVGNGLKIKMSGPNASNYVVFASTNFSNWTAISTNSALNGSVVFTDTTAKNRPMRFYRATAR